MKLGFKLTYGEMVAIAQDTRGDTSHNLSRWFSHVTLPENPPIRVKHRLLDLCQSLLVFRAGKQTFRAADSVDWRICASTQFPDKHCCWS